ncbi:MAG: hypothetical protein AB7S46_17070, partial [Flavobacteriaceae bacterium]
MRPTDSVSRIALLAAASLLVATASANADPLQAPAAVSEPAADRPAGTGVEETAATPVLDEIVAKVKAETATAAADGAPAREAAGAPMSEESADAAPAGAETEGAGGGNMTAATDDKPAEPVLAEQGAARPAPATPDVRTAAEAAPGSDDGVATGSLADRKPAEPQVTAEPEKAQLPAPESLFTAAGPALRDSLSVSLESAIATLRAENPKDETAALIADLYKSRNFEPLFSGENGFNPRGEAVAAALQHADEDGLDPQAYAVSGDTQAAREISMLRAAVLYGHQAYSGRVDASRIHPLVTLEPPRISTEEIHAGQSRSEDAGAYLVSLNPPHAGYKGLRALLAKMREEEGREKQVAIPAGQMLRPGMSDDRVPLLRERFGLAAPA